MANGCVTTTGTYRPTGGSVIEIVEVTPPEPEVVRVPRSRPPPPDSQPVPPAAVEAGSHPVPAPARVATPLPPSGGLLAGVHPELRRRAQELLDRLEAEGIHVKLLMGYTPYVARARTGPGGWASWHEFGLAFDLNLTKRNGLGDAKAHFDDDGPTWVRIGAIAAEVGLVWGGIWRSSYDPFHFEWHPGADSVINKQDLAAMLRLTGRDGRDYQKAWALYDAPDATRN